MPEDFTRESGGILRCSSTMAITKFGLGKVREPFQREPAISALASVKITVSRKFSRERSHRNEERIAVKIACRHPLVFTK